MHGPVLVPVPVTLVTFDVRSYHSYDAAQQSGQRNRAPLIGLISSESMHAGKAPPSEMRLPDSSPECFLPIRIRKKVWATGGLLFLCMLEDAAKKNPVIGFQKWALDCFCPHRSSQKLFAPQRTSVRLSQRKECISRDTHTCLFDRLSKYPGERGLNWSLFL